MSTSRKILLMIFIGVVYFVFDTMLQVGVFVSINNSFKGDTLQEIRGVWGPEDLDWDRENNLLFISSTNRWALNVEDIDTNDGIYLLRTRMDEAIPSRLKTDFKEDFHPLGISLFKVDDKTYLYVVNRRSLSSSVELFEYKNEFLYHQKSYKDEKMFSPNDVAGDQIGKFYVTNDHGNRTGFWQTIEDYFRMPYSYLLYYDGEKCKKVHQGMVYANGVNLSNDGSKVYVSHTSGHELFVLDRNISTGNLVLKETINLGSGLDNIDVDENDNIWVAAHPKLFDFVAHAKDSLEVSPTQLFKITLNGGEYAVSKIYENDGSQMSGSSVIVVKQDTAFVGSVFTDKVLKIRL